MAALAHTQGSSSSSDIRNEFKTKDGVYKKLQTHQYSKPKGYPLLGRELSQTNVTLVSLKDMQGLSEWILFNSGREFYCYDFYGTEQVPDLSRPVDRHTYRTSYPLSHDVNLCTRSREQLDLLMGFNNGPIQHLNPITKASLGIFNGDRQVDSSDVTCIKWVPGSETQFVSAHRSGNLYVWTIEYPYKSATLPTYSTYKTIKDTTIYICKPKNKFSLMYRWSIGHGPISSIAFSPDTAHLAVASQDGFLRIYDFVNYEFYARMRSYFGGLLCVCWSPDGKFVGTGGEDDLVSVWSFAEKKVVSRGEGHKSYVNAVAFDSFVTESDPFDQVPSDASLSQVSNKRSSRFIAEDDQSYRLGSVGQDGQFCLWELSGSSLTTRRLFNRTRSRLASKQSSITQNEDPTTIKGEKEDRGARYTSTASSIKEHDSVEVQPVDTPVSSISSSGKGGKSKKKKDEQGASKDSLADGGDSVKTKGKDKKDKREDGEKKSAVKSTVRKMKNLVSGNGSSVAQHHTTNHFESCNSDDIAPSMQEVNAIVPLVCKQVWNERLTDLIFREDCILIATQDGYVHIWGRPNFYPSESVHGVNSPKLPNMKHTSV